METTSLQRRESVEALKQLAHRAGLWTSFDPEKLGERLLDDLEYSLRGYENELPLELHKDFETKFVDLYANWLRAKGRCISAAITGPAKFPVQRAEKLNRYERSAYERMMSWAERFVKRANRQERLTGWYEIARLEDKVEELERLQDMMKAANVVIRKKDLTDDEKREEILGIGFSEEVTEEVMKVYLSRAGFQGFELSNNLAKIKATKERLERLRRTQEAGDSEQVINGVRMAVCTDDSRVRLYFDGKPDASTIAALKKSAFKWSPKNGSWQRLLTDNAIFAAKKILEGLSDER